MALPLRTLRVKIVIRNAINPVRWQAIDKNELVGTEVSNGVNHTATFRQNKL